MIIDNPKELEMICNKITDLIAIDTEFERSRTYFPIPSIIQFCFFDKDLNKNVAYIIDCLKLINIEPIKRILISDQILKILHAPWEDLEIFYRLYKIIPQNFFDTRMANAMAGHGGYKSYKDLCQDFLNIDINKEYQNSDWLKRPITIAMQNYAIADVMHLPDLYFLLNSLLKEKGLEEEFNNQMKVNYIKYKNKFSNPILYSWKRIKLHNHQNQDVIDNTKHIAMWREDCAINLNIPVKHILTDKEVIDVATILPQSKTALYLIIAKNSRVTNKQIAKLLEITSGLKR